MKTAVELNDVVKRFGDFTAVNHISLKILPGEIFGFLGPNGAGKSTTIRMICGLLTPTSGTGHVLGLDIISQSEKIKARIGYMSQRFSLYDDLRVEENLKFFSGVYGLSGRKREQRIEEVLSLISLSDRRSSVTWELPVGHKQRLALGSAILHKPKVIFLDEPTSGVDPKTRRNFWDLIYGLAAEGVTIFVTTHFMEEAEYCDRIALINEGRLIAVGSPAQLKHEKLPGRIYNVETSDVLTAADKLSGADRIFEVAIFGRSLHVRLDEEVGAESYLSSLLTVAGQEVKAVSPIEPTLEDVFVALVRKPLEEHL